MLPRTGPAALAVLLLAGGLAPAQQADALDLIPADAAAAVGINGLDRLRDRGDKLIAEAKLKGLPRPSDLFAMVYQNLGVAGRVDPAGSAAIILARPTQPGARIGLQNLSELLVGALPFTERDKMAAAFGFKPGQLKPGQVTEAPAANMVKLVLARRQHIFLGNDGGTITRVAKAKTLRAGLPAELRRSLDGADLVGLLGPPLWDEFLRGLPGYDPDRGAFPEILKGLEERDAALAEQFFKALGEVRFAVGALRIEHGANVSLVTAFPEKGGPASRKLLAALRGAGAPASLRGLPEGPVVVAQAAGGSGRENPVIAKVLFHTLLRDFVETRQILSATDRPVYLGVFNEVWQRLRGSRAALYLTDDEHKLGLFSLVAVLDTEDAPRFLADMRLLARIADDTGAEKGAGTEPVADPAKLVGELGSPRYRVRELATLKLRLLGEPALPHLKKAMASDSAEVARRARQLWDQIREAAAERRRELLARELPRHLRPTLTFAPRAETLAGHPVDVIRVKLGGKDVPAAGQLRQLLGPDWDRVRLAVHGKQVVVLIGSQVSLLEKTLANLKEGRPGLAGSAGLSGFRRRAAPARRIEFHVSLRRLRALTTTAEVQPGPGAGLTSFGLAVAPDALRLDVSAPPDELPLLLRMVWGGGR